MSSLIFALCTETRLVRSSELFVAARALELNAAHCALAWGLPAPAVVVIDKVSELPPACHQIVFIDDATDPGTLAVHYPGPAGRVYVNNASGFNSGAYSVIEGAGHEICEALVDPSCDLWHSHPDLARAAAGVEVALEVGDPVQDTYAITVDGEQWHVANFVTPAWFRLPAGHEMRLDYRGKLSMPGEVGPEGYLILRAPSVDGEGFVTWFESRRGPQMTAHRSAALAHPWARSRRRGVTL